MHLKPLVFILLSAGIALAQEAAPAKGNEKSTAVPVAPTASAPLVKPTVKKSEPKLNPKLVTQEYRDETSSIFEDIVAVQNKAVNKSGKFLLDLAYSIDFSDAPLTMWGVNLGIGYALGESWEIHLTYVPSFSSTERLIAKEVRDLRLENGATAEIAAEKAMSSYGVDINWVPAYGKDAWGPYSIVRSDTFFQLGYHQIKYQTETGNKFKIGVGKTFFISRWFNIRIVGAPTYIEYIISDEKKGNWVGLFEGGLLFYF